MVDVSGFVDNLSFEPGQSGKNWITFFFLVIMAFSAVLGADGAQFVSYEIISKIYFFTKDFSFGSLVEGVYFSTLAVVSCLSIALRAESPCLLNIFSMMMLILFFGHVLIVLLVVVRFQDEHFFDQTIPNLIKELLADNPYNLFEFDCCGVNDFDILCPSNTSNCTSVVPKAIRSFLQYVMIFAIILVVFELFSLACTFYIRKKVFKKRSWWIFPSSGPEVKAQNDDNAVEITTQ